MRKSTSIFFSALLVFTMIFSGTTLSGAELAQNNDDIVTQIWNELTGDGLRGRQEAATHLESLEATIEALPSLVSIEALGFTINFGYHAQEILEEGFIPMPQITILQDFDAPVSSSDTLEALFDVAEGLHALGFGIIYFDIGHVLESHVRISNDTVTPRASLPVNVTLAPGAMGPMWPTQPTSLLSGNWITNHVGTTFVWPNLHMNPPSVTILSQCQATTSYPHGIFAPIVAHVYWTNSSSGFFSTAGPMRLGFRNRQRCITLPKSPKIYYN